VTGREVELPPGYPELLDDLKRAVGEARWRAQRVVNTELLGLYWRIGHTILGRQDAEGWGARVIDRLSADLRAAYPDMRGLSRSNLFYMRSFAASWPQEPIVQQAVGRLPWGHVTVLLDKLHDQPQRDWYAAAAADHGWSRNVLLNQITNRLHERAGAAPSNFAAQLPAKDSELAQQLTRDPYVLDFLELTGPAAERDLETALVMRLQAFLLDGEIADTLRARIADGRYPVGSKVYHPSLLGHQRAELGDPLNQLQVDGASDTPPASPVTPRGQPGAPHKHLSRHDQPSSPTRSACRARYTVQRTRSTRLDLRILAGQKTARRAGTRVRDGAERCDFRWYPLEQGPGLQT